MHIVAWAHRWMDNFFTKSRTPARCGVLIYFYTWMVDLWGYNERIDQQLFAMIHKSSFIKVQSKSHCSAKNQLPSRLDYLFIILWSLQISYQIVIIININTNINIFPYQCFLINALSCYADKAFFIFKVSNMNAPV